MEEKIKWSWRVRDKHMTIEDRVVDVVSGLKNRYRTKEADEIQQMMDELKKKVKAAEMDFAHLRFLSQETDFD